MQITTITTLYDPDQDRIALSVSDDQQVAHKLWLTRRLTDRLVPALVQGLDGQIQAPADAPPQQLEVAHIYAQLQARVSKRPAMAVQVQPDTLGFLVQEVAIKVKKNGAKQLEFRLLQSTHKPSLAMTATELRQWLEALKRATDTAQWGLDVFPTWLGEARGS